MKAILWRKFGGAEALEIGELDKPSPKADELLVKVKAFTVNRTDCAMLKSSLWIMRLQTGLFRPNQPVLGTDFAGVVEAIGDKVDRFSVGDRVFGFDDNGIESHAEYMVIKQSNAIAKIPDNADFNIAAASLEGPHYAENFLNKVRLKEGQSVFVHGGTGGIGSAIIKLASLQGLIVSASGRAEHLELLKENGANYVFDYTDNGFWRPDRQYDYVFDSVGKGTFGKFKSFLKPRGIYISSELGPGGQNLLFALVTPLFGSKKVKFPLPLNRQKTVDMMAALLADKSYYPLVDRDYPLEETPEAFSYVLKGLKVGNVVVKPD